MVSIRKSEVTQARESIGPGMRPWERTGEIDVERLAQWAYGAQMVDRFERAGLHAIEAAASGFEPRGYSGCGVGQLMQIEHLGCRIDHSGASVSDAVHPAAYALASVLGDIEHGKLVRAHAQAGSRPSTWVPPVHRIRPAMWAKLGREAVVEYHGPGRKGGYCQLIYAWDEARQSWGQAHYRQWWGALAELGWRLSQRALGFIVTGPAAPAEPWLTTGDERAPPTPSGSSHAAQG